MDPCWVDCLTPEEEYLLRTERSNAARNEAVLDAWCAGKEYKEEAPEAASKKAEVTLGPWTEECEVDDLEFRQWEEQMEEGERVRSVLYQRMGIAPSKPLSMEIEDIEKELAEAGRS